MTTGEEMNLTQLEALFSTPSRPYVPIDPTELEEIELQLATT